MDIKKYEFSKSAKTVVALVLVLLMGITCLAGCGSSKKQQYSNSPTTQSQQVDQGKNKQSISNNNKNNNTKKTDSSKAAGINKAGGINKAASGTMSNNSK